MLTSCKKLTIKYLVSDEYLGVSLCLAKLYSFCGKNRDALLARGKKQTCISPEKHDAAISLVLPVAKSVSMVVLTREAFSRLCKLSKHMSLSRFCLRARGTLLALRSISHCSSAALFACYVVDNITEAASGSI